MLSHFQTKNCNLRGVLGWQFSAGVTPLLTACTVVFDPHSGSSLRRIWNYDHGPRTHRSACLGSCGHFTVETMVTGEGLTGSKMQGKLGFLDRDSSSCLDDQTLKLNFVEPNATAMLARQTDWHWVRNWGQYDAYVEDDQIQTVIRATRGHHTLWLNPRNAPFDNVRVRQAVTIGIDRETGIRILQDSHWAAGFQMSPGSSWELDQTTECAVPGWCPPEDGDWGRPPCRGQGHPRTGILPFDQTFTVESNEPVQARVTFFQE